ncbi:GlxA family transcriptional regulator [Hymenobacter glacieicola]|uniref:AraC family transcriptional regulator n=1 Tax=Hymenobacter glacieicola TaxID=1562124 RepID=A0ABQ1WTA5_9BACT|nr:helix-turn-helix domain-containing protein [Hymenobacter glacieicola]GGG44771.1 AraC family transcriptional regulator [Hymenobacter glacieicola]
MKHISILVPQGAILGSIEGPRLVFAEVNALLQRMGRPALFQIQLVGLHHATRVCGGRYTVAADVLLSEVSRTDLVIVPAVDGDLAQALEMNQEFLPWIVQQYQRGAEVASLCMGAFLLAATGLLAGRQCTTHWAAANEFRRMFPEVELREDRLITDEHGIYSSGGAFSYLNLVLYLIEKYAGREMAVFCAKVFQIDIERVSQSAFVVFNGQKAHEDEPIKKAQTYIEENYREKITVDQLASMLALGRRNLERRFKKATSNSVVEYIQRVKIEVAKNSLESTRENVNEVMYNVGYTDPKAFRLTFKRVTGLSPKQYRSKYHRETSVAG